MPPASHHLGVHLEFCLNSCSLATQVYGVLWNPYKSPQNGGLEFITYGANHLKSWTFLQAQWVGTHATFGSDKVDVILSAVFVPQPKEEVQNAIVTGFPSGMLGVWLPDSPLPQCTYKLIRKIEAHEPGPKRILPEGKVSYQGVRVLALQHQVRGFLGSSVECSEWGTPL